MREEEREREGAEGWREGERRGNRENRERRERESERQRGEPGERGGGTDGKKEGKKDQGTRVNGLFKIFNLPSIRRAYGEGNMTRDAASHQSTLLCLKSSSPFSQ
ncbi:unnamed protein product [Arctogadus glacialis]